MKKAAASASLGRNAQAARAAAARRSVRMAKARAGRGAVVAALGAGLLLHGGQATASAEVAVRPVSVTVMAAGDPDEGGSETGSGSDDATGSEQAADSADSGSADSGSADSGSADSGSADSGSADSGEAAADSGEAAADSDESAGSAAETVDAEPAASGDPAADEDDDQDDDTDEDDDTDPATDAGEPVTSPVATPAASDPDVPAPGSVGAPTAAPVTLAGHGADPTSTIREAAPRRGTELDRATAATVTRATVGSSTGPTNPAARTSDAVAQHPLTRFVLALMGVGPHAANGAPAPIAPSAALVLAQWAFFRRGENPLFNRSPVVPAGQGAGPTSGQVVGTVAATDPDGDELTYALLDGPARGTVQVNPDGSYVYVPGEDLARTGGTDTFTVVVRDNDPTAPGLGRYTDLVRTALARSHPALAARLFGAHSAVTTITVQVPGTETPAAPRVVVNPSTGTVTGRVGPDDGAPRTYTLTTAPTKGVVTFDRFGQYVYTPSETARRAAALTPGRDVDTFTVVVTEPDTGVARAFTLFAADSGDEYTQTVPISEIVTGTRIPVGPNPSGVIVSPDGRFVAVTSREGDSVAVYDSRDGSRYAVYTDGSPDQVVFSPDGTRLFVLDERDIGDPDDPFDPDDPVVPGTNGAFLHVVDLDDDVVLKVVPFDDVVGALQTSPDGRYAYVGVPAAAATGFPGMPGTPATPSGVVVVDTAGLDRDVRMLAAGDFTNGFQRSPDGTRAYAVDQTTGTLVVVDTVRASVVQTLALGGGNQVAFSPDGSRAYVVDGSGELVVIRVADDAVVSLGAVPGAGWIDERSFSPDGRYLAFVGDGEVAVVDVRADRVLGTFAADAPSEVFYSPDGGLAYVSSYRDDGSGVVTALDLASGTSTPITVGEGFRDVTFSPDGARAYVTSWTGTVAVIDTATATVVGTIAVPERSFALRLSPDGTRAYVTSTNDSGPEEDETGDLTVIDLATGATTVVEVGDRPGAALVSADGRRVYVTNYYDGSLSVIDGGTGAVVATVSGTALAPDVAFTPDGRFAYVVDLHSEDGGILLVRTADDVVTFIPAANISVFESVRVSPDGRYLYVEAVDDGQLVVVDLDAVGVEAGGASAA